MTIPGSYKPQPVRRIGSNYQGELIRQILTEVDRELQRTQDILGDSSTGIAPDNAAYVTIGNSADLSMERALTGTATRLTVTDNGANSTVVLDVVSTPLLDANVHSDTVAQGVTRGSLIYGNATPKWDELVVGTATQFLKTDGTDVAWTSGAALTKTDDTNVTLTLGGSHATSLVNAASLTLGWTGQLALTRGGTGINASSVTDLFNQLDPLTTRGDLLTRDATNSIRIAIGAAGRVLTSDGTDPAWSSFAFTGFANPTASVGLSAVNGTATTAMRSDGAPALSQAIAPTWTGTHTWNSATGLIRVTQADSAYKPIVIACRATPSGDGFGGSGVDDVLRIEGDDYANNGVLVRVDASAQFLVEQRFLGSLIQGFAFDGLFRVYGQVLTAASIAFMDITTSANNSLLFPGSAVSGGKNWNLPNASGTFPAWNSTTGALPTAGALLYGGGASTVMSSLTIGASGTILTSTGAAPQWSTNAAVVDIARSWTTLQTFPDNTFKLVGSSDASKTLLFELDSATANADLVVSFESTNDRTLRWILGGNSGTDLTFSWTGTTTDRTVTIPNASFTMAGLNISNQTFTVKQTIEVDGSSGAQLKLVSTATGFGVDLQAAGPTADRTLGVPDADGALAVVAGFQSLGESNSIGTTTLVTAPATGNYVISYSLECDVADAGETDTVAITFGWTDSAGAATRVSTSLAMNAAGRLIDNNTFSVRPVSGNITYAVTVTGTPPMATARYAYSISVLQVPL